MAIKQKKTNGVKILLFVLLAILLFIGLCVGSILIWQYYQEQKVLKNIEKVAYDTRIPFDPQKLKDTTETSEGEVILNTLMRQKTETTIPPNSKIRFAFDTYCMDAGYSAPYTETPVVFTYEKYDMPMASEIITYVQEHPDVDREMVQHFFWYFSPSWQETFDYQTEEEQQLMLSINPRAKEIIDSYEYNTEVNVKNLDFGIFLPEDPVPQQIPGSPLSAKITDTSSYSNTELEVYNPTEEPQTFQLQRDDGTHLVFVPVDWIKTIKVMLPEESNEESMHNTFIHPVYAKGDSFDLEIVAGKDIQIKDGIVKTGPNGNVLLRSPEGNRIPVGPNTQIDPSNLPKSMPSPLKSFWDTFRPPNKFQRRTPTIVVAVRG